MRPHKGLGLTEDLRLVADGDLRDKDLVADSWLQLPDKEQSLRAELCLDGRAVEIDPAAAAQAKENIQSSPWSDRMEVICSDFRDYHAENKFDLIVSNPPYFVDALKCPDNQRCMARHTNELNYELLFGHSTHLLSEQGIISVIIPSEVEKTVIDTAWKYQLYPYRCLHVFTKPGKPYRRVLLAFSRQEVSCTEDSLYIEGEKHGKFTSEYISLTKEFYLKM